MKEKTATVRFDVPSRGPLLRKSSSERMIGLMAESEKKSTRGKKKKPGEEPNAHAVKDAIYARQKRIQELFSGSKVDASLPEVSKFEKEKYVKQNGIAYHPPEGQRSIVDEVTDTEDCTDNLDGSISSLTSLDRMRKDEEEEDLRKSEEEAQRKKEEEERLKEIRLREEEAATEREKEELRKEIDRLRRLPPNITDGMTPIERAYRMFDILAHPTRETLKATTEKADGLEIVSDEVDVLPWNSDGTSLDYARLRDMLEAENRRRLLQKKITKLWRKCERPDKAKFKEIVQNMETEITVDDLDLVLWDDEDYYILEADPDEEADKAKFRRIALERRKVEMEERQKRKAEISAVLRKYVPKKKGPPPVTMGDSPIERAYRWYTRFPIPSRDRFLAVLKRDSISDITEADIDLLPWIAKGTLLDYDKLNDLLHIEEQKRKSMEKQRERLKEELQIEEHRNRAYQMYNVLGKPTLEIFYRIIDLTIGLDITKDDVDLLPWDSKKLYVKEF